jgi:hypothetical protein
MFLAVGCAFICILLRIGRLQHQYSSRLAKLSKERGLWPLVCVHCSISSQPRICEWSVKGGSAHGTFLLCCCSEGRPADMTRMCVLCCHVCMIRLLWLFLQARCCCCEDLVLKHACILICGARAWVSLPTSPLRTVLLQDSCQVSFIPLLALLSSEQSPPIFPHIHPHPFFSCRARHCALCLFTLHYFHPISALLVLHIGCSSPQLHQLGFSCRVCIAFHPYA